MGVETAHLIMYVVAATRAGVKRTGVTVTHSSKEAVSPATYAIAILTLDNGCGHRLNAASKYVSKWTNCTSCVRYEGGHK